MSTASPVRPPSAPEPAAGTVAVWHARLDDHRARLPALAASLAADERERIGRFRRPADADAFALRRGILRELLAGRLGIEPAAVRFSYGRWDKPVLDGARLTFNASSSGGVAFFALGLDRPVGIDVERIRPLPDMAAVAARILSPHQATAFAGLSGDERLRAFYAAWTQKEAYVKALGDGFAAPLDAFDVPLAPAPGSATTVAGHRVEAIAAPPGYAAAVAYAAAW